MAAKFVDLRKYSADLATVRAVVTKAAEQAGFEVISTGRDSLMLHGDADQLNVYLYLNGGPDLPFVQYEPSQIGDQDGDI